jgi:sodium/potassium-transporting ATPase subunit alpha
LKAYIAKKKGKSTKDLSHIQLSDEDRREAFEALMTEEAKIPVAERKTAGDASESGLIKFCHTIMDINETRKEYPTFAYEADGKANEALIPFSSEIKFNMFIRDMNSAQKNPKNADDNLFVIMKGAPERILNRCSKILVRGEERDFDDEFRAEVNEANDSFGKMGERVLAFARFKLDPKVFTKDPAYRFDVKTWKNWKDVKEFDPNVKGWFPMWNLTLVGIVSLNDPPRPSVAYSVEKCKQAGIKVIMVTGDQPPTAAAIAHKVNIITNPSLEYNYLVKECGMGHE